MTRPGDDGVDPIGYSEPARSYLSSALLAGLLVAGFLLDLFLGGGLAHGWAWATALVLVAGIDALTVHAARSLRSITVTGTALRVGAESVPRAAIVAADPVTDPGAVDGPVLGRSRGLGLPRGSGGLRLGLADGTATVVPTRSPERLAAALGVAPERAGIRPAEPDELSLLAEIDERADTVFRVAGYELLEIPFPAEELVRARAVLVHGRPPDGFAWLAEADGTAYLAELAVLPGRMRRGIGTALLKAACDWARANGYPAITLTTFADVAWNAPFYAARGFVEVGEPTPELAAQRTRERALGLDQAGRRIVMRRDL